MKTTIVNTWITVPQLKNGATVQRKYAGINTMSEIDNTITYCVVSYWECELYPDGTISKQELKTYTLEDLERTEWTDIATGVLKHQDELKVLSGFVASLGTNYIINPCRETISNLAILPLNHEVRYPLHRDTRTIKTV